MKSTVKLSLILAVAVSLPVSLLGQVHPPPQRDQDSPPGPVIVTPVLSKLPGPDLGVGEEGLQDFPGLEKLLMVPDADPKPEGEGDGTASDQNEGNFQEASGNAADQLGRANKGPGEAEVVFTGGSSKKPGAEPVDGGSGEQLGSRLQKVYESKGIASPTPGIVTDPIIGVAPEGQAKHRDDHRYRNAGAELGEKYGPMAGPVIGALIGFGVAGPLGLIIGAMIGHVVGGVVGSAVGYGIGWIADKVM